MRGNRTDSYSKGVLLLEKKNPTRKEEKKIARGRRTQERRNPGQRFLSCWQSSQRENRW